jgi:hypothetical protein
MIEQQQQQQQQQVVVLGIVMSDGFFDQGFDCFSNSLRLL